MADDGYEYMYDTNETSTFLVELDLSTLNGIKRDVPRPYYKRRKTARGDAEDDDEERVVVEDEADLDQPSPTVTEPPPKRAKDLQILEGDSLNPIVAYKGNFYSCSWHDMIGTNMFYSLPHQGIDHVPMRSTRDYNLLGTSRVKLVGQRAKASETTASRKRQRVGTTAASKQNESTLLGSGVDQSDPEASPVPIDRAPTELQEQTTFLQKLAAIQQARQTTSNGTSLVDHQVTSDVQASPPSGLTQTQSPSEMAVS